MHQLVLTLNETTGKRFCRQMSKLQIMGQRPEQRYALANEDRDASDRQFLNLACPQETLDCFAAIHIYMPGALGLQLSHQLRGRG